MGEVPNSMNQVENLPGQEEFDVLPPNKKIATGAECDECKEARLYIGVNFCPKCGTDLRR